MYQIMTALLPLANNAEASSIMPYAGAIGIIGSVLFLGAFGALNIGWVDSESYLYQIANLLGASCFTYTALAYANESLFIDNWGLFITEFIWALLGLYGIIKIAMISKKRRAAAAEKKSA